MKVLILTPEIEQLLENTTVTTTVAAKAVKCSTKTICNATKKRNEYGLRVLRNRGTDGKFKIPILDLVAFKNLITTILNHYEEGKN